MWDELGKPDLLVCPICTLILPTSTILQVSIIGCHLPNVRMSNVDCFFIEKSH